MKEPLSDKEPSNRHVSTGRRPFSVSSPAAFDVPSTSRGGCACGGFCPACSTHPLIQKKVKIGGGSDSHEHAADQFASKFVGDASAANQYSMVSGAVSRKVAPPRVDYRTRTGLGLGDGEVLPPAVRSAFEARLNIDLSSVRIHAGTAAANASRQMNARAFALGPDIGFDAGEYNPESREGRWLLAHELAHVFQQSRGEPVIRRACRASSLAARPELLFFPRERVLTAVSGGARVLSNGDFAPAAIGLVQQALVDLGYDLGTTGRRNDGVDRDFGPAMEQAIEAFQRDQAIAGATSGVLDQDTLRCLDSIRGRREVPEHQAGIVAPDQYRIEGRERGGRDEDIFFARGSAVPTFETWGKVARLAATHQGCSLTLEGYISEDERVEFGDWLASARISVVDNLFAHNGHDDPGVCPAPVLPLRTPMPRLDVNSGVADYRSRRKVEVVPAGAVSQTAPCPRGSSRYDSLTGPQAAVLDPAVDQARDWVDTAISKLTPGHPEGDPALNVYFGGTGPRGVIVSRLRTWRRHLDTVVRRNNRFGNRCDSICDIAIAYNDDYGSAAQMTLCPRFFDSSTIHGLNKSESKAFVVLHEGGHGAIRTRDTAYGHHRLIEFMADYPGIAGTNTDSYTLMILCLNGQASLCSPPSATDVTTGLDPVEEGNVRRGLGWLQTWLIWSTQDVSGLYRYINDARDQGSGVGNLSGYYSTVFNTLGSAFDIHRAPGDPPPNMREQTLVASIRDRLQIVTEAVRPGLEVEKDTSPPVQMQWEDGGPHGGPGRKLYLIDAYFNLSNDRDRVDALLPLIIEATDLIDSVLKPRYELAIRENVRRSRNNRP